LKENNDISTLILIFYFHFAGATDMKDKNKITYSVDFKVECPLCKEMIPVGYAGPIGLVQHQGKKKCRATCEQNQKNKKKANIRTLFDVEHAIRNWRCENHTRTRKRAKLD